MELIKIEKDEIILKEDAKIEFKNYETIKKNVTEFRDKYVNLVMVEGQYKDFKNHRAELNKSKDAIETLRKGIKKDIMKPYNDVEKKTKELVGIIDEASKNIEKQINEFDTKTKDKKHKEIQRYFTLVAESYDWIEWITFENIFNEKWLNSTFKMNEIEIIICNYFGHADVDYNLINLEPNGGRILTEYLKNGYNFVEAKTTILQDISKEAEEQARIDADLERRNLVVDTVEVENIRQSSPTPTSGQLRLVTAEFKVTGTIEQLKGLKEYIINHNMRIEE